MASAPLVHSSNLITEDPDINNSTNDITNSLRKISLTGNEGIESDSAILLLQKELDLLECPFSWHLIFPNNDDPTSTISSKYEKIEEIEEEGPFFWRKFLLTLLVCYEYSRLEKYSESLEKLRECEAFLNCEPVEGVYKNLFNTSKDALKYIILSCKCHIFYKQQLVKSVKEILSELNKYEELNSASQATIQGIHGVLLMEYGVEGNEVALPIIEKAIELNSEEAEWHFLLGKCLGRLRRINNYLNIPEERELKALEKAVNMTRNPSYIIFLAQAYREAAFRTFSINRNEKNATLAEHIEKLNHRSSILYQEVLKLRSTCSHIIIRCATGLYKLPYPYKDVTKAKELIKKAIEIAPTNIMALHVAGNIFERCEKDNESALQYYEKASKLGGFGAHLDIMKLKFNMDKTFNGIAYLENMLELFTEKPRTEEIICQLGSFCFFIKDDFMSAIKYWKQVIVKNPNSVRLKKHKSSFIRMMESANIYELMVDEAHYFLKRQKYQTNEDKKIAQQIIIDFHENIPELQSTYNTSKREKILQDIAKNEERFRNRQGRKRGRGGFRGRGRGRGSGNRGRISQSNQTNNSRGGGRNFNSRYDSRTQSGSRNNTGYPRRSSRSPSFDSSRNFNHGSRDSSMESRDGYQNERKFFANEWKNKRDSSNESRSSMDRNWRSGPRNFDQTRKESSSFNNYRSRTGRSSSEGSEPAINERKRSDSDSSVGSDSFKKWRAGCSGAHNKNDRDISYKTDFYENRGAFNRSRSKEDCKDLWKNSFERLNINYGQEMQRSTSRERMKEGIFRSYNSSNEVSNNPEFIKKKEQAPKDNYYRSRAASTSSTSKNSERMNTESSNTVGNDWSTKGKNRIKDEKEAPKYSYYRNKASRTNSISGITEKMRTESGDSSVGNERSSKDKDKIENISNKECCLKENDDKRRYTNMKSNYFHLSWQNSNKN